MSVYLGLTCEVEDHVGPLSADFVGATSEAAEAKARKAGWVWDHPTGPVLLVCPRCREKPRVTRIELVSPTELMDIVVTDAVTNRSLTSYSQRAKTARRLLIEYSGS